VGVTVERQVRRTPLYRGVQHGRRPLSRNRVVVGRLANDVGRAVHEAEVHGGHVPGASPYDEARAHLRRVGVWLLEPAVDVEHRVDAAHRTESPPTKKRMTPPPDDDAEDDEQKPDHARDSQGAVRESGDHVGGMLHEASKCIV
jgi:hypothetical protein